jgi:hypothetical protein
VNPDSDEAPTSRREIVDFISRIEKGAKRSSILRKSVHAIKFLIENPSTEDGLFSSSGPRRKQQGSGGDRNGFRHNNQRLGAADGRQGESPARASTGSSSSSSNGKSRSTPNLIPFSPAVLASLSPVPPHPPSLDPPIDDGTSRNNNFDTLNHPTTADYLEQQPLDPLAGFGDSFNFDFMPTPAFIFDTSVHLGSISPSTGPGSTESGGIGSDGGGAVGADGGGGGGGGDDFFGGETADAVPIPLFSFDLPDGFFIHPPATREPTPPAIHLMTSVTDFHDGARGLY